MINRLYRLLQENLDPHKVLRDADILEGYSRDETPDMAAAPDILVRAENADDVSMTLKLCSEHKIPVTPRGAGTGVTGGALPVMQGVVLSLEKCNRILEIDRNNMVAVVEPGAVTGDIQKAALEQGLMYPPDPASLETCSIGGNVAEGAGGPRAVKYGTTKDYILGLEFVLPDGSLIQTGGKIVKNATGYNLAGILIGSEGTLAVITKIYLKLIPAPKVTLDILLPFDSLDQAIDAVHAVLMNRVIPAALEFMEQDAISLVSKHIQNTIPCADAGAHLLIQIDGNTEDQVLADLQTIVEAARINPDRMFVAQSPSQKERLWKARRSIRESIQAECGFFAAEDCVVPRAGIPQFVKDLKAYFHYKALRSVMFGHAGDGNVHIDILKDAIAYDEWKNMLPGIKREIYSRALACGGTITGEHGIGCLRKEYLPLALSSDAIDLSRRIKAAFDPGMILNPGKIFP
ncbi:MAG: FAD-binding oxidoreductase [Deltaproteobacteria bacterium]|nr:FAD-binding oxidoreductase [Deltaproteobacteria bacterium]